MAGEAPAGNVTWTVVALLPDANVSAPLKRTYPNSSTQYIGGCSPEADVAPGKAVHPVLLVRYVCPPTVKLLLTVTLFHRFTTLDPAVVPPRAGTSTRTIKLWDNVTVSSNLNVQGTLTVNGSAVTGGASTPQPISMGIGSGTGDFSSPCTYYKDSSGLVHLQGQAASSSSYANAATAYYTFPSGYRPQYTCAFASAANGVFCVMMVYTDGRLVNKIGGANGYVLLDGITFLGY